MSIATELTNLNDNILDAYTAVHGKGGTIPANKNMVNLPTAISSISGGVTRSGIPHEADINGVYGFPAQNFSFSLPADATDVTDYCLYYGFYTCQTITSADLSSLTTVSGNSAFQHAFRSCINLGSVDFSSLTTVSGASAFSSAFNYCTSLTSVDFSSLTTVSAQSFNTAFSNCTSLASVSFDSLTNLAATWAFKNAFEYCTSLTSLSFPALTPSSFGQNFTNQFDYMLRGVTGCTVHFPAAIQSTIGNWSSVRGGFDGTNTTVLFDL